MFDRRISTADATALPPGDHLATVRDLLSSLEDFAAAGRSHAASQQDILAPAPQLIAARYAAANSITRRRFDALLSEAETVARMGFGLIASRQGRGDPGTIAAARFLGKSIAATLQRLENLLAPRAI
ncbi:hypothetical protein ASE00_12380 [Sphingomonas sp. Root710]|uniref:hypothetical protein n=1 Tax=Sphingomonas sp. Root710 TaxID=1736594 RepID=UPI0006FB5FEF|nr:hypothetical protein [Sphingomonas sp. Root710]KRB82815.1 hypothetical protein ASE00_12380 [Sphingomonas sp. Root710]